MHLDHKVNLVCLDQKVILVSLDLMQDAQILEKVESRLMKKKLSFFSEIQIIQVHILHRIQHLQSNHIGLLNQIVSNKPEIHQLNHRNHLLLDGKHRFIQCNHQQLLQHHHQSNQMLRIPLTILIMHIVHIMDLVMLLLLQLLLRLLYNLPINLYRQIPQCLIILM